jgi:hypothetical protein
VTAWSTCSAVSPVLSRALLVAALAGADFFMAAKAYHTRRPSPTQNIDFIMEKTQTGRMK